MALFRSHCPPDGTADFRGARAGARKPLTRQTLHHRRQPQQPSRHAGAHEPLPIAQNPPYPPRRGGGLFYEKPPYRVVLDPVYRDYPPEPKGRKIATHPLESVRQALEAGDSIILFPEGSRGEAEQMGKFKSGVAHLAKMVPHISVIPVYLGGAGKVLPKGEALLVPFIIDVHILEPMLIGEEDTHTFTERLEEVIKKAGERDI